MKILQVHNRYQYIGGEDTVVQAEYDLLTQNGQIVKQWIADNAVLREVGGVQKISYALKTIWSTESYCEMENHIEKFKPDVIHVHNTLAILSASIYAAADKHKIPVVQTLHNYGLFCMNSLFFRDGHVCEDCMGKIPYPALIHQCYRDSLVQTGVLATSTVFHRMRGTYQNNIARFIALTEFSRSKFVQGGLSPQKVVVKPNFGPSNLVQKQSSKGNYGIFVGRLSVEKGLDILLSAMTQLPDIPIKLVGDGPLTDDVEAVIKEHNLTNIDAVGRVTREEALKLVSQAQFLVLPSVVYENFPMTIVEAFACGVPVITSKLGAMGEIVEDGRTGLHFTPKDSDSLAGKIKWAWDNLDKMATMGEAAYQEYANKYTEQKNYEMLMALYEEVIQEYV